MSLLGRLRTGPRLFAAFLLVFALSALATVVGLVGLSRQHSAAVEADHLRVLVGEMDQSTYYTSDIGAWQMGVGMDAYTSARTRRSRRTPRTGPVCWPVWPRPRSSSPRCTPSG